jgi:uncharacterized protein (TIGR02246 family)
MTELNHDTNTPADEAAIRALFDRLVASWNSADGSAYGECFTDDADYVDVTGTHTVGREAIARMHQFLFDGPLKGSQLETGGKGMQLHFLTPGVALVIGGGTSRLAGQTTAPDDRRSISTSILVKRGDEWRIRAFQNNRVQPVPFGPPAQR